MTDPLSQLRHAREHTPLPRRRWLARAGIVYVLRLDTGVYKIGRTRDLKHRLADYRSTAPAPFRLVHTIPTDDPVSAERYVHALFAHCRQPGELFSLNDAEAEWLLTVASIGVR